MKTYIKKGNLKSTIVKLKKSLESKANKAKKSKNQLFKNAPTIKNESTTNPDNAEEEEKKMVQKLQKYVLAGKTKIKSMKSGLFNTEVSKEDEALVLSSKYSTNIIDEYFDTNGDGNVDSIGTDTTGDGKIDTYRRIDTMTCTCSMVTQCKIFLSEKNCCCRSARNVKSCCYSCCCKKKQDDFPSPFDWPTIFFSEFYSNSSNSLKDFIKSKHTYELDQKSEWTTNGRTTIERFDEIYSDWCD